MQIRALLMEQVRNPRRPAPEVRKPPRYGTRARHALYLSAAAKASMTVDCGFAVQSSRTRCNCSETRVSSMVVALARPAR